MKQYHCQKYLKLLLQKQLISMLILLVFSCQHDNIQESSINESSKKASILITTVQRGEILENKKVLQKLGTLKKSLATFNKRESNKVVYSNGTGLEINTNFATYIEYDNGYHSYTFLVTNTPEGEGLQNILLSLQEDGSYKEFLVHYNITESEIVQIENREEIDISGRFTMTEINGGFTEEAFSKVLYQDDCVLMEYIPDTCSGPGSGGHVYGEDCNFKDDENPLTFPPPNSGTIVVTEFTCYPGGSGSGSPNDGWTPGGTAPPYNPSNPGNNHGGGSGGNSSSPTTGCKGCPAPEELGDALCTGDEPLTGPSASLDLSGEARCFLVNHGLQKQEVDDYLDAGGDEAFAIAAIEAWLEDGEVDWDDLIINNLKNKALCIYNELVTSNTGFKNAIKKFEPEFPVSHLTFTEDDLNDNTRGVTSPPSNYMITITINNDTSNSGYNYRPNLLTVKTIIHEVVHAEMFRKLLELANDNGDIDVATLNQMLSQGDYPGMLDYYTRYGLNGFQHQQMATHYRETIARILQEYDTGTAVDENEEPLQIYLDLAWEGLNHSNIVEWQELTTQEERDRVDQVISDYITAHANEGCN